MDDSCTQNPRPNIGHADQKHQEIGFDAYGIFGSHVTVLTSFPGSFSSSSICRWEKQKREAVERAWERGWTTATTLDMEGLILCSHGEGEV